MQESSGTPDLPSNQRLIELEYASMDDRRLRGQMRDVPALELQVSPITAERKKAAPRIFLYARHVA